MSWSVNAKGTPEEARKQLDVGFAYPLADSPQGLSDEGERETVRRVRETIDQCLETFAPEKVVIVSAFGHVGFDDFDTKSGRTQNVSVTIKPE